ncbi:transport and Golgi organization protein 1 homolog isoform X2 [Pogoniulus pusillus]|uniref:transport and Golgi organization protein 1 homolog isoform X2 n=1 Tax=Pogoniulus pusillus TaxID=488313 RepID=UPI0030B9565F
MAAAPPPDPRLLLALLLLLPPPPSLLSAAAGPDLSRRFAERKRCADPDCSMLMCRGKAMRDFKGPDCRFVNFKKGEAVYVYHKLIGKSTELWAGSVGSDFGYFPKDLLEINHNYSNEELELPTDDTDFVCFDGGRDDFDNYNVDDLLKPLQETIANEGETESSDSGTKPAEATERSKEIEQADAVEMDNLELSTEDKEVLTVTEEADSSLEKGTENTGGDPTVSSHEENSQGDEIAHEHLKGTLHGKLKGLESENTKNTSVPQGETSQLDHENEEVDAYTLLNRELSVNLKTKFGSTADAVVSDDEVTRLVTSLEDDLNEGLSIDAHDAEEETDFADQSAEIPLLSFTAEEDVTSPVGLEDDENDDTESQSYEPDKYAKGATELKNQRDNEEERDSDALIPKDAFSKSKKSTDGLNVDRSESKQTKENRDDVKLISKREELATTQPEELLRKELVGTGDLGSKEKTNRTEQFEGQLRTESLTEEQKSTAVPDPHTLPPPGDDLESKSFIQSRQDALRQSVGDINRTPEKVPPSQIEKYEKKLEDDILEEVLESDLKHKKPWEKTKEKRRAVNNPSVDVPAKPVEEVKNASQSDLGDNDLLKEKLERGIPAVEKEMLRHEEDLKQTGEINHENQNPTSLSKEPEMEMKNMKKTPTGEAHLSHRGAIEQPGPWENATEYSEADVNEELSRNLGKVTAFDENTEKSSSEEKSKSTKQNTGTENLTLQGTEDADPDRNLGTSLLKERTLRAELSSEEPEDDPGLKQAEEELLEDENAASAKLSQARAANVLGDTLNVKRSNPELEALSEAVPRAANPTYETGEETNSFSKEAKKIIHMQDANETGNKEVEVPVRKDAEEDEIEHVMENEDDDDDESSEAEEPPAVEEYIHSPDTQSPDTKPNDLNQREDHLPEGVSQKDSKEVQILEHTRNDHGQSAHSPSPADSSAATNDTVTDFSESVKRLAIMREFLDEKRVTRLQKYLGLQHTQRIEAMIHDMKVEMELARKASHNNEEIEKALDQILEFSESSIMDVVGKVLDSRVAENKEEVVKEMDLYDEESALMDDIQELIYTLRSKYSSASESVPLASIPEQEDDELHVQDGAKEAEYNRVSVTNSNAIGESNEEFQQLEDKRPEQPIQEEEEEEEADDISPEHEEVNLPDIREAEEQYDSGKESLLGNTASGSVNSGQSASEDTAADSAEGARRRAGRGPEAGTAASPQGRLGEALPAARQLLRQLVATLPEEIRPGPDFHGLPWEPVIITALVGIATLAIIFWRTCLSVKSRIYQVTEKQLAEKIKNLLQEKTEILEKISEYDQKIKEAKESVKVAQEQKDILSDETAGLKDTVKELEEANHHLDDKVKNLHKMLETERKKNEKKQNKISETQKSLEKLQEAVSVHSAELSEVQVALNEAKLSEEKVKAELHRVQEENAQLKKSKEQLLKEAEGWSERHTELSEQIKLYQKTQKDIEEALAYKENEIEVLTNCIMQLKQLDMDSAAEARKEEEGREWSPGEDLANGELPDNESEKMKTQIKQMMDVSRVKTMLSLVEEDRNVLQSKLSDEVAARHELEEQIKKLEHDSGSLQSAKARLENECKTLQQKVEILGELYQQKEMALQKKLTQEEYERQEKEQKLSAADEKAVLAIEEVKVYKQRIQEMEEELQKTERSYKNQIAAHEKKAHDNWLIARSAERALAEEKREAANLRQKLIEVNQKIAMLQRPLIVKPTPGRPNRQVPPRRGPLSRDGSFGPSPVSGGNPSPTQMIEAPARPLSAPRREGSRGEFGSVVDGPPAPRRPPELPGRMSVPDLGPAVASLIVPRTSSPSTAVDGAANAIPKGPPSFPGTPIMTSPAMGPPPPPPLRYGPPPAALRGHFGPRPLPVPLVRGAPLPPPAARDFLPGPPLGMRDLPPGPLPPPPDPRGYGRGHPPFQPLGPPGPRDYPPGPRLPPPGARDYTPSPNRDLPPSGPRDYPPGPPPPASKDYTQPPVQKP